MRLEILGTGTSTGVPQIGCECPVCTSHDVRDNRLRTSALVSTAKGNNILIDCGPDFRQQILRAGSPPLTAALLTHIHYDHVAGLEDLRPYCAGRDFDIYCTPDVASDLRMRLPYCFVENKYPGVPSFNIHEIDRDRPFEVNGDEVVPLPVMHARLPIVGFKIGKLSYVTDCKTMPAETLELMRGTDTLVINALRHEQHLSHMNLEEALDVISAIKPRRALLTHVAHQMGLHADVNSTLPPGIQLAHDGMTVEIPD